MYLRWTLHLWWRVPRPIYIFPKVSILDEKLFGKIVLMSFLWKCKCIYLHVYIFYFILGVIQKKRLLRRRGEGDDWKANKNKQWEGCPRFCVYHFFKKNAKIFKMTFYSYSPVFPIDYNDIMKYLTNHHEKIIIFSSVNQLHAIVFASPLKIRVI